ncbi:replicative DNA helicase [Thermodesulfobacteriota bacterium]
MGEKITGSLQGTEPILPAQSEASMNPHHSSEDRDLSLHKLPPQNIEAEASILSAVLIENQTLLKVIEILSPEDFYREGHRKIYRAMLDLFQRDEPADLITLSNMLREQGELEAVGGAAYLAHLVDAVPMAINAPYYARIVRDKAVLRGLIAKATEIANRCYEGGGDADEIVDFAQRSIFDVTEQKVKSAFSSLESLIEESLIALEKRCENKALVTGVPTGYYALDNLTSGFQPSDLIILAGRPSMGKTALALNIARNAAVTGNIPVAIFSLEMSKEHVFNRMLCAEARVDASRVRGGFLNKGDFSRIAKAGDSLSQMPIYIDDSAAMTVLEIRAKARRLKMEKKLGMIVVDYIQLMKGRQGMERRELEISEISRSLKALAKEVDVPVVALSQLNRRVEDRSDKKPQLADLRESGALEQDADVICFIYRDEVYNKDPGNPNRGKAEILVAKQRNGPVGVVHLTFQTEHTRFDNPAREM